MPGATLVMWRAPRHQVWDAAHGPARTIYAALAVALALWLNGGAIVALP